MCLYKSLSDAEFCEKVYEILFSHCSKEHNIQDKLECYFLRSFSSINKRFKRVTRRTIFEVFNEIMAEKAISMLKEKQCFEVMLDLGFKYESNFARWLKTIKGKNPSDITG